MSFEGVSSLHSKGLCFYSGYDSEGMPKAKGQKREHLSAHGCKVLPQPPVGFRRPIKNQCLTTHLLEGSGEAWCSRPRETAYTSIPSNAQKNSTNDLNATHKGAITPPGLQFKIFSVYSGSCSYNLPPRAEEQGTDRHTPLPRFMLTTVPVKLLKQAASYNIVTNQRLDMCVRTGSFR